MSQVGFAYRRRQPDSRALYQAVLRGVPQFFAAAEEQGAVVPRFVERELLGYLRCGKLEHGFVRVACADCQFDRLVAFSCKGRGLCPSCGGRRMAELAIHLSERVLPRVPVRQWVLSLPPPLRYMAAYDTKLSSLILGHFTKSIFRWQRHEAQRRYGLRSVSEAHSGAVTVIQRFGSAVNLNLHYHTLSPDGVFVSTEDEPTPRFRQLGEPSEEAVEEIAWQSCQGVLDALRRTGRWTDADEEHGGGFLDGDDELREREPLMAKIYGGSLSGRLSLGPSSGSRVMRFGRQAVPSLQGASSSLPAIYGFNVHAKVCARDDAARTRLCRYLARPPVSQERVCWVDDNRVSVRLKRAWHDGTTHLVFTPLELVERLVALIPRPRSHLTRYHGVFAPHHALRSSIVPQSPGETVDVEAEQKPGCGHGKAWAQLMARVFEIDVLECPRCHSRMQQLQFVTKPDEIRERLEAVGYPGDSPAPSAGMQRKPRQSHGRREDTGVA